jgi:hypothetical protein
VHFHFLQSSLPLLFVKLAVSPGQPSLISDDADVVALIGTSKDLAKQINQKEVHWGVCMLCISRIVFNLSYIDIADSTVFFFELTPVKLIYFVLYALMHFLFPSCLKIPLKSEWRRH